MALGMGGNVGMINLSENAQTYFRRLLETQGGDAVGIRLSAVEPGTPRAEIEQVCDTALAMQDNELTVIERLHQGGKDRLGDALGHFRRAA